MAKLQLLIIHCTATPEGRTVLPQQIFQWHKGPCDLPDGTVKYLGKIYTNRAALPNELIYAVDISLLHGRGWKQIGYTDMFMLDGDLIRLVNNNEDDEVDSFEVTNGVLGYATNSISRNIVYVGGCANDGKLTPKDTRTEFQKATMEVYVKDFLQKHPQVQVAGHNQFDQKACPSFNVPEWCHSIGIPKENICPRPLTLKL